MKKQLIAMAVAAGMVAPMAAMAEATVYGLAHMSIDFGDDGQDSSMNVSSNASRLGFKASHDLDNGMKAGVQFEGQVDVDQTGYNMNRNSFASLGGGFGEFRIGNHDTPFKDVRSKLDMFGDRVGDLRNLTRWGAINANSGAWVNQWDERFKNSILYISPKFADSWVIKAHYTTNQYQEPADGEYANGDAAYSLGVNGMIGPVGIWLAYENYDFQDVRTSPTTVNTTDSTTGMRVGLQYKGGPLLVNFMYQSTADGRVFDPTTGQSTGDKFDKDVMSLGLGWKMGKNTIKFQYAMADDLSCTGPNVAAGDCDKTAASMFGIGLDHALSKQTTVYIMYAVTQNDDNADYRVTSGGGHGDDIGMTPDSTGKAQDPSSFSVGTIVKF